MVETNPPDNRLVAQFGAKAWRAAQVRAHNADAVAGQIPPVRYVFLGPAGGYTLADGLIIGERVGIKDNIGDAATTHRSIYGKIDEGTVYTMDENGQAMEFVWNGTEWSTF